MYNKMQAYVYSNFVKQAYRKVLETNDIEEVYYKNNKLVVFVKNEEIGQQLYEIIKSLLERNDIIEAHDISFQIDKFYADKQNIVKWFCIKFDFETTWEDLSRLEKLLKLVDFVYAMNMKGYVLEESMFEDEKCKNISNFLSFFKFDERAVQDDEEDTFSKYVQNKREFVERGCLIKHIHYVLSDGGDFGEFYQRIVNDNVIYSVYQFPYSMPIIKMCYKYYSEGIIVDNILDVLQKEIEEKESNYYDRCGYLVTDKKALREKLTRTTHNHKFSIYDGNIKIYHNVSSEFEEFLRDNELLLKNEEILLEQIDGIIIDFDEKIIGYTFKIQEVKEETENILEKNFEYQFQIINIINLIDKTLLKIIETFKYDFIKENDYFDLEEFVTNFKIKNVEDLFNLVSNNEGMLNNKITALFFKLLLSCLNNKYGEICDKKQFLEKPEVRYLSPILAREFINFALFENLIDYNEATEKLFEFLKFSSCNIDFGCFYDFRFDNTFARSFLFDYEAESKYGITTKKEMQKILDNGRKLVIFKRKKRIQKFYDKEESLKKQIKSKIGYIEDEHVKIIGISELICSTKIDDDNTYELIGYISEPIKGKQLTDDVLLNLTNKQMLKVFAYLFAKFGKYYIPWEHICMDDDFIFYIDILDENFRVIHWGGSRYEFLNWVVNQLCYYKGYNPNAFFGIDFKNTGIRSYLCNMSDSLDAYCDEHKIFYNSKNKMCPVCLKTKYMVSDDFEETANKLFEDSLATHYSIDSDYNLKVYKTDTFGIDDIEKNVNNIIDTQLEYGDLKQLYQECFIPYKKAVNSNFTFIGYIYKAIEFGDEKNGCVDITDSQKLKNLPRLMSIIRLLLQVKDITSSGMGFIYNPFSYVFLSRNHKKQVQILNIELLSKEGNVEDTIKWTCEYVYKVLIEDFSIEVNISKNSTDIDSILGKLKDVSKDMTKYCAIHNMYYKNKNLFCPMCISKSQMKRIGVEEIDVSEILKNKSDNTGGESFIYYRGKNTVFKIFDNEVIDYDFKNMIILQIIKKMDILEKINKRNLKFKYVIPKKILVDSKSHNISGYSMKRVKGHPISILKDKKEVAELKLHMDDVFEILITIGEGIETLHKEANMFVGDLNGQNILFDSDKNVYFLDFDGMGIDDIMPKTCTDEYIDPVSDKNHHITMKDDWYSFAVQAFHYLTFVHPFNGLYSTEIDGKEVRFDIVDKMEHRISLLGNHGIKIPTIAVPWDWMNKELENAFLDIFEHENRESIVPYLKNQCKELYGGDSSKLLDKIVRINSIFIAKKVEMFGNKVVKVINHYAAVCIHNDDFSTNILVDNSENTKTQYNIDFPECMDINNILLSDDNHIAWAIYKDKVIAFDLEANTELYREEISDMRNVVINGSTLYFTDISDEENVIFQRDLVKKEKIRFLTKQLTRSFLVRLDSKFVVVKSATNNRDEIYCNSDRLCNILHSSDDVKYNIIYDDIARSWLVINNEGNGIVIDMSKGDYDEFNLPKDVKADINVDNVYFHKRNIYAPSKDCLYIFNFANKSFKEMKCNGIMTSDSELYDINSKGFSVVNDNVLYDVRRG